MFVVAHISDLHFDGTPESRARISSALHYIESHAAGIDVLLVSGDIADEGTAEQYAETAATLRSPLPMLVTVGNHDNRERFSEAMLGAASPQPINSAYRDGDVLLLALDSSIPGRADGLLSEETLAWTSAQIDAAGPGVRVLMAMHHPPVPLGMPFMDTIYLTNPEHLAALLDRYPNIVGILCGHAHSPVVTSFAGRPVCVAPGVASTLNLPFEGHEIVHTHQPPGIAFHLLDGYRLITHFRAVVG